MKGVPIRWLLAAFAAVLLAPVLALAAVALTQFAASERARYEEDGRRAAHEIATDLDDELGQAQAAAQALATSPLIPAGDYEAFQRQASEFVRTTAPDAPTRTAVVLRDLTGRQLANTDQPWGTPLSAVERDVDRRVVATKRPQVQDLFFSASAGRPVIAVRVPVLRDGEVTHILSVRLETKRIAALLRDQTLPATWNRAVLDRNDRIVARWPNDERFAGAEATEDLRRNAMGKEGSWIGTNLEGTPVLAAYARSKLSDWRVVVGIPLSMLEAPLRRSQLFFGMLCAVAFAMLTGLAFWLGRRISRPIHALEAAADKLARGESVRPVTAGLRELDAVSHALALASDDLRERERALKESEARLRATYDNAAVGIIEVGRDERILQVNRTHCELMGRSRDELVGRPFTEPTFAEDLNEDRQLFRQQVDGKLPIYTIEKRHFRADGAARWARVSSTAVHDAAGRFVYAIRVVEDVTERKEAEQALRESEGRLRATYDNAAVGIVELDRDGRVLNVNETHCKLMGYSREELIGKPFSERTHPDDRERDWELFCRQVNGEFSIYTAEKRQLKGDGSVRWARVSSTAVRDAAGHFLYAVRVIEDISEQKQAEERQRLLVREFSHRMKNAFATVRALAFLFLHQDQPLEIAREQFETRLAALARTHDLLTLGSWKGTLLRDVLTAELEAYAGDGGPRFVASGPDVELASRAVLALGMVFHELATNAAKYGGLSVPQGRVEVTWRKKPAEDGTELLELEWREIGGPAVSEPGRKGFGSRLIRQTVTRELSGSIRLEFERSGLQCVLAIPLTASLTAVDRPSA